MSIENLIQWLNATDQDIANLQQNLTTDQLQLRKSTETWSVLEILEHLAVAESKTLRHSVQNIIPAGKSVEFTERPEISSFLATRLKDDQRKIAAPESVQPKGRYADSKDALIQINANTQAAIDMLDEYGEELRGYSFMNVALGVISLYQWIEWIPAHRERHLLQMKDILGD